MGHGVSHAHRHRARQPNSRADAGGRRDRQGGCLTNPDFLIVGAGLTGATIAHALVRAGHSVLVLDRRAHVAGNVFDYEHPSGIRVHAHGPHYFRTSSRQVWDFVRQFGEFHPYQARVLTRVDGELEVWPVTGSYLRRVMGGRLPRRTPFDASNFEQAMLARLPRLVFDRFVREYTEKQWGVPAHELSPELAKRVPIRSDDDPRLTPDATYQGIPTHGYTALVERMLHAIPLELNVDYLAAGGAYRARRLTIFTGPIDEFFGYSLGRLAYRGQRRVTSAYETDWLQPGAQVNEPQHAGGTHIRTIEWKHLMPEATAARIRGTVVTMETPYTPDDPDHYEYPFPSEANRKLYREYRMLASQRSDVLFCGRLGEYRYLDMDQAIARAQLWARRILSGELEDAQTA